MLIQNTNTISINNSINVSFEAKKPKEEVTQALNFNVDTILNKHILKSFLGKTNTQKDEATEEKRELWLKEKIYKIKETVLYNNLNQKYFCNFNTSNISCKSEPINYVRL